MSDIVLCDTDIMSALAKADELEILELVFSNTNFQITEYVRDELDRSKQEGFAFPVKIFEFCGITTLNEDELKIYESTESLTISKTDMKNLIIARNRDITLLTNDSKLYRKAVRKGIKVYDLRLILKAIYLGGMVSKSEFERDRWKNRGKDISKRRKIYSKMISSEVC